MYSIYSSLHLMHVLPLRNPLAGTTLQFMSFPIRLLTFLPAVARLFASRTFLQTSTCPTVPTNLLCSSSAGRRLICSSPPTRHRLFYLRLTLAYVVQRLNLPRTLDERHWIHRGRAHRTTCIAESDQSGLAQNRELTFPFPHEQI